jgi:hypothetical protein
MNVKKYVQNVLLLIIFNAFPLACCAQGQLNALAFFGTILHLVIILFILIPLTFLFYKRIKTGRKLFSFFIYLWSVPNLLWLGYAAFDSILDPNEKMDKWSFLILCYFLIVLTYLILTFKKDIKEWSN